MDTDTGHLSVLSMSLNKYMVDLPVISHRHDFCRMPLSPIHTAGRNTAPDAKFEILHWLFPIALFDITAYMHCLPALLIKLCVLIKDA